MHFPVSFKEQQQEMWAHSLPYERLQGLLRKCQDHLCCSKRVWNEDGECVTLPWEVITGSSKPADYVNFTGHSLLGHHIFYLPHLRDTSRLGNESTSVLLQMHIKSCGAREQRLHGCRSRWLDVARWYRDNASCAQSQHHNHSPSRHIVTLCVYVPSWRNALCKLYILVS